MSTEAKMAKHIKNKNLTGKVSLYDVARATINRTGGVGGDTMTLIKELKKLGIEAYPAGPLHITVKKVEAVKVEVVGENDIVVEETDEPVPADNIADLVKASQYSQKQLAERLKVSKSTVYRAIKNPSKYPEVVASMYDLLGVSQPKQEGTPKIKDTKKKKKPVAKEQPVIKIDNKKLEALLKADEKKLRVMKQVFEKIGEVNALLAEYFSIED